MAELLMDGATLLVALLLVAGRVIEPELDEGSEPLPLLAIEGDEIDEATERALRLFAGTEPGGGVGTVDAGVEPLLPPLLDILMACEMVDVEVEALSGMTLLVLGDSLVDPL
jgi:hypothetical protein